MIFKEKVSEDMNTQARANRPACTGLGITVIDRF